MRMCCGCNQRFDQRRLIRLQVSPETQALIPVETKLTGRSAWVCYNFTCIKKIHAHPKRLQRSLRTQPKMDNFSATLYSWLLVKVRGLITIISRDGAICLSNEQHPIATSSYSNVYTLPSELSKHIRLQTIDFGHTPVNETTPLQMYEHHLRQSTILCLDVLINLKLDSFR